MSRRKSTRRLILLHPLNFMNELFRILRCINVVLFIGAKNMMAREYRF
ncbi:hypothetical protein CES86_3911 [Brucella lupini]|uniref:Uncharacterized protein n=1 Tax=Brucella lupini TaxID=255457 RepID=A0A256GH35_9HYPH|nr:hypothetical protein CES86_3911 [Brucella lupini]